MVTGTRSGAGVTDKRRPTGEAAELADALVATTLQAGRAIMRHYRRDVTVMTKGDDSPVTLADQEAEAIILEALAREMPQVPVVAEEQSERGETPQTGDELFLVDPLDGTRGFIKGRTEFTVNIALVRAGVPVFGIIYAPALNQFYASIGPNCAVAADITPDTRATRLAALDCRRIQTRPLDLDRIVAVSSRYVSKRLDARLKALNAERMDANSSIKFCMVARGDADIYPRYGEICEWDTAAGAAILMAAGGSVTDLDGTPSRYGKAASNFRNKAFVAWSTPEPPPKMVAALRDDTD